MNALYSHDDDAWIEFLKPKTESIPTALSQQAHALGEAIYYYDIPLPDRDALWAEFTETHGPRARRPPSMAAEDWLEKHREYRQRQQGQQGQLL